MGTSTSVEAPPARPRQRGGVRRIGLLVLAAISGVVLAAMLLLIGLRVARAGVLPGVVVGDAEVGGLDPEALRAELGAYAGRRGAEAIVATRPPQPGDPRGQATLQATAEQVGYQLDTEATAAAALARGRQANPVTALTDQLRAFGGRLRIEPVERVDDATLGAWVDEATAGLRLPPQEGTVRFEGVQVVRVEPIAGLEGDTEALRADAQRAALSQGPDEITIRTRPLEPSVAAAEVDAAAAEAERAVSAPVTLTRGEASVALTPEQLATVLRVEPGEGDQPLRIVGDPEALRAAIGEDSPLETPPVDAGFALQGGTVVVVDGTPGFRLDPVAAATVVRDLALAEGPRTGEAPGEEAEPERTRAEAEALGITTQVSTFTTQHPCCANRVSNIHRIADLIRGVVIQPGDTFSVNDFVGERTTANGFLADAAIDNGEFVQQVGGGVSQFATTMFNAAYLGGYDIPEHKPHSQYISRYPVGREATLNYDDVDLKVRNNSPCGLYVDTSYTGTSITVSFYGCPWVEVATSTGPRRNFTPSETIVRPNPSLAPGEEVVVQQGGGEGFTVTVTRTLTFPDGRVVEDEPLVTTYMAKPTIVERAP